MHHKSPNWPKKVVKSTEMHSLPLTFFHDCAHSGAKLSGRER